MSLAASLAAYLSRTRGETIRIENLCRIFGGASRETYRFDALGGRGREALILRRDPPGSLIETDRRTEFLAIRSFEDKGVHAPRAVALEEQGAELGRPFFIMERLAGAAGGVFAPDPYGEHAAAIGEAFFSVLGAIAAAQTEGLPICDAAPRPGPADCWRRELDYWAGVIDDDEDHPQPIVRAAIRRLRRNPPPAAAKICVVHGDYRSGNFLHDGAGAITGVMDWEMAHLGDPLEDLAWAFDPLWSQTADGRVSGMVTQDEAISIWRRGSGLEVDAAAFAWWRLFASVKAQAIWISSAKAWRDGGYAQPILAFAGWWNARRQDEILADHLEAWESGR